MTVQSSGLNSITTIPAGVTTLFTCILTSGTTAASWDYDQVGFATITGTGDNVLATSPTLVTPLLGTPTSGNFSTGTFTWPTFNQNTSGTAAGLSATLAVSSGGTGQTSYTNGQLLIGNTTGNTLTKATLTAGTGITITNGTGSITIASSGGSGDVVGPASATNNGIVLFDSTTGKLIKDSATSNGLIYGLTVGRGAGGVSSNTALGSGALSNASTTGGFNTALGRNTLVTLTSGEENTAVGNSVLNLATTGGSNVGVGNASLAATTTGGSNVAVGLGALQRNTSASFNTAIGTQALTYNTTATYSTAVGYQAGYNNTTGASGLFVGAQSGYANTTGNYNSFVGGQDGGGYGAGASNTTGANNTALGSGALSRNTTASNNTAIGFQAGLLNTTGAQQTLIGYKAGASLTLTGADHNTAVGYNALTSATGSACEVNTAIGSTSLSNLTSGLGNTALGYGSGVGLTTGVRCTFIGRSAVGNNANAQEEIVISAGPCTGQGDNYVTIGKNGAKIYNKYDTNATWTYTSDGRLKQNITADSLGLSLSIVLGQLLINGNLQMKFQVICLNMVK